ncbi:MAG: transposase [Elusimicrobia bacterium]|nr:transposase [Elusimicrobiota bacterium]
MTVTDNIYHIFNKSIAKFVIYNKEADFQRMIDVMDYYQLSKNSIKFSKYKKTLKDENPFYKKLSGVNLVEIISYCIMPTHFHMILKQKTKNGIPLFIKKVCDSYTRYFNIKHNRKGPLWEGKYKNVLIKTDVQLLHLTRYLHLNPVTSFLINKPEEWKHSSYLEFLNRKERKICSFSSVLDINPENYKNFVEDRILYQRDLANIKKFVFD